MSTLDVCMYVCMQEYVYVYAYVYVIVYVYSDKQRNTGLQPCSTSTDGMLADFFQNTEHGAAEKVGLHQRASFGGVTVRELHLTPGGGRSFWCDVCCRNGSNAKLSDRILQFRTHCRTSIGKPAGVL